MRFYLFFVISIWCSFAYSFEKITLDFPNKETGWYSPTGATALVTLKEFSYNAEKYPYGEHAGIDIFVDLDSPVYSINHGKILYIKRKPEKDKNESVLIVKYESSDGKDFCAIYGHVKANKNLKVGDTVYKGEDIGRVVKYNDEHIHFGINLNINNDVCLKGNRWGILTNGSSLFDMGFTDPMHFLSKYEASYFYRNNAKIDFFEKNYSKTFGKTQYTYPSGYTTPFYSYPFLSLSDQKQGINFGIIKESLNENFSGLLSLIIARNHYDKKYTESKNKFLKKLKIDINHLCKYSYKCSSFNTLPYSDLGINDLYEVAEKINYFFVRKFKGLDYLNVDDLIYIIKSEVAQNHIIIFLTKNNSPLSATSTNKQSLILFSINDEYINYVDPWDGRIKRKEIYLFKDSIYLSDEYDMLSLMYDASKANLNNMLINNLLINYEGSSYD